MVFGSSGTISKSFTCIGARMLRLVSGCLVSTVLRNDAPCLSVWSWNRGGIWYQLMKMARRHSKRVINSYRCKVCCNFFLVTLQLLFMIHVRDLLLLHFLFDNIFRVKAQVNSTLYKSDGFSLILYSGFYLLIIWLRLVFQFFVLY